MEKWKNEKGFRRFYLNKKGYAKTAAVITVAPLLLFFLFAFMDPFSAGNLIVPFFLLVMIVHDIFKTTVIYRDNVYIYSGFYKWTKEKGIDLRRYIERRFEQSKNSEDGHYAAASLAEIEVVASALAYNENAEIKKKIKSLILWYDFFGFVSLVAGMIWMMLVFENIPLTGTGVVNNNILADIFDATLENFGVFAIFLITSIIETVLSSKIEKGAAAKMKDEWLKKEFPETMGVYLTEIEEKKAKAKKTRKNK